MADPRNIFPTFISGYNVKPQTISEEGVVTFADASNNSLTPNQRQCEAYGYKFDTTTNTCRIFIRNQNVQDSVMGISINSQGNNDTGFIVKNSKTVGVENVSQGGNTNCLAVGSNNNIESNIKNATVLGVNGNAYRQSEFVIGGGQNSINEGAAYADRQMSVVQLSGYTTDNTATSLSVNNLDGRFIPVKKNSIIGWEVFLTRLEVGGSSGTAGNFSYRLFQGCTVVDNSYSMTFTTGFTRNIAKAGVNGTFAMVSAGTGQMTVQVTDRNNVNNIWNAIVYLHELTSTNITF